MGKLNRIQCPEYRDKLISYTAKGVVHSFVRSYFRLFMGSFVRSFIVFPSTFALGNISYIPQVSGNLLPEVLKRGETRLSLMT
jgi:hypothetical protein